MNIYNENGYVDIKSILGNNLPFNFIVGGRGTGKTFGALDYVLTNKVNFILLRRTQAQIDIIGKKEFSPFKALERYHGIEVECKSISKYTSGFYVEDELIGLTCALSTFSNLRGFSSSADLLIFDEFIPERHERPIKEEGSAFLNVIETINRNRELDGGKPIQVLCLANANDIGNPIFMELGLVKIAEEMKLKGREFYKNPQRGLLLVNLENSPISKQKEETALYKLIKDTSFKRMALSNEFIEDKHNSERKYYVSEHIKGRVDTYSTASADIEQFRKKYYYLWGSYLGRKIIFENKLCSVIFEKLW